MARAEARGLDGGATLANPPQMRRHRLPVRPAVNTT